MAAPQRSFNLKGERPRQGPVGRLGRSLVSDQPLPGGGPRRRVLDDGDPYGG